MDGAPFGAPPPLGFFARAANLGKGLAKLGRVGVARTKLFIRPREAGEGDHAKRGGGGVGAEVYVAADAPPTALCAVPPPRYAGRDEERVARTMKHACLVASLRCSARRSDS
jgi:hypothetical protein